MATLSDIAEHFLTNDIPYDALLEVEADFGDGLGLQTRVARWHIIRELILSYAPVFDAANPGDIGAGTPGHGYFNGLTLVGNIDLGGFSLTNVASIAMESVSSIDTSYITVDGEIDTINLFATNEVSALSGVFDHGYFNTISNNTDSSVSVQTDLVITGTHIIQGDNAFISFGEIDPVYSSPVGFRVSHPISDQAAKITIGSNDSSGENYYVSLSAYDHYGSLQIIGSNVINGYDISQISNIGGAAPSLNYTINSTMQLQGVLDNDNNQVWRSNVSLEVGDIDNLLFIHARGDKLEFGGNDLLDGISPFWNADGLLQRSSNA